MGGLFLGHPDAGIFPPESENIVEGLAAQAAIAMDNAKLYEHLQESIEVRDEFFSIASHELKTPLTSLKLQVQAMQRNHAKGDPTALSQKNVVKLIDTSDRQINRLVRLVDEMLDYSRIHLSKLHLEKETFDLCELITEVTDRMREQLKQADCSISLICPKGSIGSWDRQRIEQVYINLLTNAMRYAHGKPIAVEIKKEGDGFLITVQDQGEGIAPEHQNKIFERFGAPLILGKFVV